MKLLVAALWVVGMAPSGTIADPAIAPVAEATELAPGRYRATISPSLNAGMARRIEKALGRRQDLESVSASVKESTLHFTVKSAVKVGDLQLAVERAFPGAVLSTPILANSLNSAPGI